MDSLNLISTKKEENFSFKKNYIKGKILLKCIIILLVLLFISNIYIAYFIFDLGKKVNTMNMDMKYEFNTKKNIVQKYNIVGHFI